MFKFFVHHAFHIAHHFHQFHLRQIRKSRVLKLEPSLEHISASLLFHGVPHSLLVMLFRPIVVLHWHTDSDAELRSWNLRRWSGSSGTFERKPWRR
jgi:hypothetical protein